MTENPTTDILTPKRSIPSERERQAVIERLWLTYYNDTLFAKGAITEEDRNRMRVRIKARAVSLEQ